MSPSSKSIIIGSLSIRITMDSFVAFQTIGKSMRDLHASFETKRCRTQGGSGLKEFWAGLNNRTANVPLRVLSSRGCCARKSTQKNGGAEEGSNLCPTTGCPVMCFATKLRPRTAFDHPAYAATFNYKRLSIQVTLPVFQRLLQSFMHIRICTPAARSLVVSMMQFERGAFANR
jgi:hypothetical protein